MEILFGTAAVACAVYYGVIVLYVGVSADFSWIWLLIGGGFGLLSGLFHLVKGQAHGGLARTVLGISLVLFAVCAIFLAVLSGLVMSRMGAVGEENLPFIIVLGAQVKGDRPSRALRLRLEAAREYAVENPDTVFLLSGGQGTGEDISEAECMRRYLTEAGIAAERMILEDQSTTTAENLRFCAERIGDTAHIPVGIISNNFHIYRAEQQAKKLGYGNAQGIAAKSDPVMQAHYVVREAAALIKMWL